jgi:hypothetical protein
MSASLARPLQAGRNRRFCLVSIGLIPGVFLIRLKSSPQTHLVESRIVVDISDGCVSALLQ